jgi:hypothetical protein
MPSHKLLSAAKKCPRCGNVRPRFEPVPDSPGIVRCSQVISDSPFEECDFEGPDSILQLPFVRIGASGLPSFGQTTWNFVSHVRLWNSAELPGRRFSRLDWWKGNEAADRQYEDQLIRWNSVATQTHRRDAYWSLASTRGLWGWPRNFILSVEDFPGEYVSRASLEDASVCHLLDCDAFVLFVDPTKNLGEYGQSAYEHFVAQWKVYRQSTQRQRLDTPVALAVPKLDLLLGCVPEPVRNRAERLVRQLRASGPMNEATNLAAIRHRHELTLELSRGVFPLQDIASLFEVEVGAERVRVFPVATLGWSDLPLEDRFPQGRSWQAHRYLLEHAFGILDPLLWTLDQVGLRRLPQR